MKFYRAHKEKNYKEENTHEEKIWIISYPKFLQEQKGRIERFFHNLPNMVGDMVLKNMGSKPVNGFHRKMRIIYEVSFIHKYTKSGKNCENSGWFG